jgi:hypothetical protein
MLDIIALNYWKEADGTILGAVETVTGISEIA